MDLRVECHRDVAGRVPCRFGQPGSMHDVESVIDRWPASDHSYFRVRTFDGVDYILRHDEQIDAWQIHFLDVSGSERFDAYAAQTIDDAREIEPLT